MAGLIVAPEPQDINIVQTGSRLLNVEASVKKPGVTWQGIKPIHLIEGLTFGIWQNVSSVRMLLAVTAAAGIDLPSRGTYPSWATTPTIFGMFSGLAFVLSRRARPTW